MDKASIRFKTSKKVDQSDTALNHGSGLLNVFATPAMVALMEKSAHQLALANIPEGLDTVGIEISVKHTRATPVGKEVFAEAVLEKQDGKRLYFTITAYDNQGEIGTGTHIRYIIDPIKFMERTI
ncbi:MAG: thioesterase family protein [Bacteroidales bacterium]|jgi:predicted thioesterase|nr:thioesterase family protein [Bacteroidales bacterium]MDD3299374.1 thioesterase family protein [Bacteroidales bacterium]MDD3843826.1 thioesterase family protein [Bacteroidales bacterium]MDD4618266.1 thioesterase family protein [Bacteroidales bacterium]